MVFNIPSDCGNSPKNSIISNLYVNYAYKDINRILESFHPNISWEIVGDQILNGIDEVNELLEKITIEKIIEFHLFRVISHGKYASAMGEITLNNRKVAFSDHFEFTSASSKIIKSIKSFSTIL